MLWQYAVTYSCLSPICRWLGLAMRQEPVSQVNNPLVTHLSQNCREHEAGKQASKQASKQAGKAASRQ